MLPFPVSPHLRKNASPRCYGPLVWRYKIHRSFPCRLNRLSLHLVAYPLRNLENWRGRRVEGSREKRSGGEAAMATSLQQFVADTRDQRQGNGAAFEVEKNCFLQVNLGTPSGTGAVLNQVWIKTGSMVAYQGDVKFEREGMMEHGFGNMLKKSFTGEGATLTRASSKGRAQLYLADNSKRVAVLLLQGESIIVNGDDLLAFEPTVTHKITMMKKLSSIVSGGLYNVALQGRGYVAILSHGQPLTLMVAPGFPPVFTDPQATVAWSGGLVPDFKSDVGLKTLIGRSSGETFQMKFDGARGQGFVVVQPHEEVSVPAGTS